MMASAVSSEPGTVSGSASVGNFGDSLSSAAGAALASLQKSYHVAEQHLLHKSIELGKLQSQKQKIEQKLAESSATTATSNSVPELIPPPTPKNTPFFMTPPLTPPNESLINHDADPGKPPKPPSKVRCNSIVFLHSYNCINKWHCHYNNRI